MKRLDKDQLLKEVLSGEHLEDFRLATLECGLGVMRRRRRRRKIAQACALACLPLLAFLAILLFKGLSPSQNVANSRSLQTPPETPPAGNNGIKIITDEQLFALFPNRPMALVGKPGRQQLIFLDQPQTSNEPLTQ